jgi:adenylosuccinate lyase
MNTIARLDALSPLDGRYADTVAPLREYFSEFALFRDRVRIELAYLRALSEAVPLVRPLTEAEDQFLLAISGRFNTADAQRIQELERTTEHDVKAVEYYLRERLDGSTLEDVTTWLHFGLTSEDVNQTAIACALLEARDVVMLPALDALLGRLKALAVAYSEIPMLARTHGQPAVPTTVGKEFANYYVRVRDLSERLASHRFTAKLSGAVGNFNALVAAAPTVDWPAFSTRFLGRFGLVQHPYTTQVMPYDNWVVYLNAIQLTNTVLLGLAQDLWRYISDNYFTLKTTADSVGSSTMPQKVNPIDLENAEGNLGLANALLEFYTRKLPITRLQRDLSDSTVRRTFGVALGHTLLAWTGLGRGLDKLEANAKLMQADLEAHWEVIAEGAQTILRAAGVPDAYEQLRALTRGKTLDRQNYLAWVDGLVLSDATREQLRALAPTTYIGLAPQLVAQACDPT